MTERHDVDVLHPLVAAHEAKEGAARVLGERLRAVVIARFLQHCDHFAEIFHARDLDQDVDAVLCRKPWNGGGTDVMDLASLRDEPLKPLPCRLEVIRPILTVAAEVQISEHVSSVKQPSHHPGTLLCCQLKVCSAGAS